LFKKKVRVKKENQYLPQLPVLHFEQLPINVIQFTYEELMKEYEAEPDNEKKADLQMKLVLISKILTDRSLGYGNGEARNFFIKRGEITEEKWNGLSEEQRNHASLLMESIKKMEREFDQLAKSKSEKIEFSMGMDFFATFPHVPDLVVEAINFGRPLVMDKPQEPISALLEDFAFFISKKEHKNSKPEKPSDTWNRVYKRYQSRKK